MALHVNDVVSKTFSLKALLYFQHTNSSTLKPKYHLKKNIPKKKKKVTQSSTNYPIGKRKLHLREQPRLLPIFQALLFSALEAEGKSQQSKDCTNDKNRGLENRRKSNRMEFFFPEINGAARCSILPSKCALQSLNQV